MLPLCANARGQLPSWRRMATAWPWFTGGGPALTRVLKQLGKQSEFIGGLRVTDAETRDVALMVLGGMVNKKLVAAIQAAGMPAGPILRRRRHDVPSSPEVCSR